MTAKKFLRLLPWLATWLALAGVLSTCSPEAPALKRVQTLGLLRVATLNSPTTYYVGNTGPTGFEYDLARGFAENLGVKLEVIVVDSPPEILELVRNGRAHVGAAGLAITPNRKMQVRFTQPVSSVVPQLIYRQGNPKPKTLEDLNGRLAVPNGSGVAELLATLKSDHPGLTWEERDESSDELLYQVVNANLDYTIANSNLVAINQRYYPRLRVAFPVAKSQDLAWAFAYGDDSLYQAAVVYLQKINEHEMHRLRDRHFGHVGRGGYVDALTLATHSQTRLPRYRKVFETAAARSEMDWRLLAAVGYQESLWDPEAVSPTGVRGIMQITTDTADYLRIQDRLDPIQSILGGARYLGKLREALPEEIQEPDRTWMTLAAYNMGVGHLLDVRELTRQLGGDPNRWLDVRNNLPLLTQSKWYRNTRHGYARGHEAVTYVGNVRSYYDMLTWLTGGVTKQAKAEKQPPAKPQRKKKKEEPLNINSPVL